MTFKILTFFLLFGIIVASGCATRGTMCSNIPDGQSSAICEVAGLLNVAPEDIANFLYAGQMVYLETDTDSAEKAHKFLQDIKADLTMSRMLLQQNGPSVTFGDALKYLTVKYDMLPKRVQLAIVILDPAELSAFEITTPMSEYDLTKMIKCVDKLLQIVEIYRVD